MKRICKIIILILSILHISYNVYAEKIDPNVGYNIIIKLKNYEKDVLYLNGYYGGQIFIFDSTNIKNGKFTFKNKTRELPGGIYSLTTTEGIKIFDILIDQSRSFSISSNIDNPIQNATIKKSDENKAFFEFQKGINQGQDLTLYIETSPNSFLSKYIKAIQSSVSTQLIIDSIQKNTPKNDNEIYSNLLIHYFDQIDLSDSRIFRSPMILNYRFYFENLMILKNCEEEEIISYLNRFLERTIDTNFRPINFEIQYFYVKKIMQLYMSNLPVFDPVFVYLYDHYFKPEQDQWGIFDISYNRVFTMVAERKQRTMVGKEIEPIVAYDISKNRISSSEIKSMFTILWFWDPDCDHCITETPLLHDFYLKKHQELNFEVIAVSVTEDYERWKKYINEHKLDWINLSYSMGEPNYDFLDFFDLVYTPGIFIINKDHKIIGRQISLDKIQKILESNTTTNQ